MPVLSRQSRFTDRWPGTAANQNLLHDDLAELSLKLDALAADAFSPAQTKNLLQELFGETAAEDAVVKMMERRQRQEESGGLKYGVTGAVVTGTTSALAGRSRRSARALRARPVRRCNGEPFGAA